MLSNQPLGIQQAVNQSVIQSGRGALTAREEPCTRTPSLQHDRQGSGGRRRGVTPSTQPSRGSLGYRDGQRVAPDLAWPATSASQAQHPLFLKTHKPFRLTVCLSLPPHIDFNIAICSHQSRRVHELCVLQFPI